ncbi:hypothetical protein BS78_06G241800 [Paspalum vaginatum]|nr:hypothetical protein BS78_06G241800 [Paspalum vaginatum]
MGDHTEMLHAAPAMYSGAAPHGGWWNNTAVPAATCSTELGGGFTMWSSALAASYDMAAEVGKAKSATTASSESPGNNSSVTFQEPTGVTDPAGVGAAAVGQQPLAAGYADCWTHPYMSSGATLHGFLQDGHQQDMSSRTEQSPMSASSLMNPSSNNLAQLQGHQEPPQDHHQLLSSFGSELLLSPTSPYGFQQSSSLLRSLLEPTVAKPALPGYQQYDQYQQTGQAPPAAAARFAPGGGVREPLQFTNDAPFWNPSDAGFGVTAAAPGQQATVRSVKRPSPAPRAANLALKTALEGVGESSSIITKKKGEPAFKKPRLETPSPLPTFKVRKEKLGDRVTALQQLVAPFGKALSAPYLKNGHHQVPHSKSSSPDKSKDSHGEISLKGRGLCLVPISSTFAVASEVPVDFWTPFGANFR